MNYFDLQTGFELHLSACWVFACVPTAFRSHCACAGPTHPIVLTIVHLDGTSILSLHTTSLKTVLSYNLDLPKRSIRCSHQLGKERRAQTTQKAVTGSA